MKRRPGKEHPLRRGLRIALGRTIARTPAAQASRITIIDQPTEQTTAATNIVLMCIAAGCGMSLLHLRQHAPWKATLWATAFGTMALIAVLGAAAHGFKMSEKTYTTLWKPLNLGLGIIIALFVSGVVYDVWGKQAARRILPPMLAISGGFWTITLLRPGSYLEFVLYQSGAMLFALGAYTRLAQQQRLASAELIVASIITTITASAIQASERVSLRLAGYQFDHNGAYHLVQMAGILLLYAGLRASLQHPTDSTGLAYHDGIADK
jgi:hypothetical protein